MLSQMKDLWKADDDRSTAIAPLLRKVASLQRDVNRGVRRAMPGRRGDSPPTQGGARHHAGGEGRAGPARETPGNTEASPEHDEGQAGGPA